MSKVILICIFICGPAEAFSSLRTSGMEVLLQGSTASDPNVKEAALAGLGMIGTALTQEQLALVCRHLVQAILCDTSSPASR